MFREANNDALKTMAIMKECGNFMADIFRVGKVASEKLLPSQQYEYIDEYEENVNEPEDLKQFQEYTANFIQMEEPYQMLRPNILENQSQQFPLNQSMYPQENFSDFMTQYNQVVFNENQPEENVYKIKIN